MLACPFLPGRLLLEKLVVSPILPILAVVTGALTALVVLAARGREKAKLEGPLALPFGTFLALSGIYCVFLGTATLEWYLKFFH